MTSGTVDTRQYINPITSSSGLSTDWIGALSNWSGGDRVNLKREKRKRITTRFVTISKRVPYNTTAKLVGGIWQFFDLHTGKRLTPEGYEFLKEKARKGKKRLVRTRRVSATIEIPVYEPWVTPAATDYRTPHAYHKNWDVQRRTSGRRYTRNWDPSLKKWYISRDEIVAGQALSSTTSRGFTSDILTWSVSDDYKLISKLVSSMRGSEFNLASFIGAEGRDTLKFMAHTAETLAKSLLMARKGNIVGAIGAITGRHKGHVTTTRSRVEKRYAVWKNDQLEVYKQLVSRERTVTKETYLVDKWRNVTADQWLEYHLAVEPLLGDMKSGAEFLAHQLNVPQRTQYRTGRIVRENGVSASKPDGTPGVPLHFWNKKEKKGGLIAFLSEHPSVAQLSGLYDPEIVIWNAIPLSFVADWIIPISDWMEARAWSKRLVGTFVKTVKLSWDIGTPSACPIYGILGTTGETAITNVCGADEWRVKQGSIDRTVSTSLSGLGFGDYPPVIGLDKFPSWQRCATALALVVGLSSDRSTRLTPL